VGRNCNKRKRKKKKKKHQETQQKKVKKNPQQKKKKKKKTKKKDEEVARLKPSLPHSVSGRKRLSEEVERSLRAELSVSRYH